MSNPDKYLSLYPVVHNNGTSVVRNEQIEPQYRISLFSPYNCERESIMNTFLPLVGAMVSLSEFKTTDGVRADLDELVEAVMKEHCDVNLEDLYKDKRMVGEHNIPTTVGMGRWNLPILLNDEIKEESDDSEESNS